MDLLDATVDVTPTCHWVMDTIRRRVGAGAWPPGARIPSVRTLARTLDVSQAIVSQACGELIRLGVLRSERGRGMFVVETHLRATLPVGLLGRVSDEILADPSGQSFGARFFRGLQQAASEANRTLKVLGDIRADSFEPEALHALGGAIIFENFSVDEIIGFKRLGLPFVVADMDMTLAEVDSVVTDNAGGMATVLRHLLWRGARRLMYIHPERVAQKRWDPALDERLEGFRIAAQAFGVGVNLAVRSRAQGMNHLGIEIAEEVLSGALPMPDALVFFGDEPAAAAAKALRASGVDVPGEVQVTGFGHVAATKEEGKLATVGFDAALMGRYALELLIERQRDPGAVVRMARVPAIWHPGDTTRPIEVEFPDRQV